MRESSDGRVSWEIGGQREWVAGREGVVILFSRAMPDSLLVHYKHANMQKIKFAA
jgi:hypothetical protein